MATSQRPDSNADAQFYTHHGRPSSFIGKGTIRHTYRSVLILHDRQTKKPKVEEDSSAAVVHQGTKKQRNSTPKQQTHSVSKNSVPSHSPLSPSSCGTDFCVYIGKEAGQALEKAAQMQLKTDEKDDAANTLVESYKSYRRTDPTDAARVLKQAISLFTGKGNFRRAAGYQFNLAELYEAETELFSAEEALDAYDAAAEWYASDQADAYVPPLPL